MHSGYYTESKHSKDDIKEIEQRKAYKAALKAEFEDKIASNDPDGFKKPLPFFARYTKTATIYCKYCKTQSLDNATFKIHIDSEKHKENLEKVKDAYARGKGVGGKEGDDEDRPQMEDEDDDEYLKKRAKRGTMYMDEKVEILNPLSEITRDEDLNLGINTAASKFKKQGKSGGFFGKEDSDFIKSKKKNGLYIDSLPSDFFDDDEKRRAYAKESHKNFDDEMQEYYKEKISSEIDNFLTEARMIDPELVTNIITTGNDLEENSGMEIESLKKRSDTLMKQVNDNSSCSVTDRVKNKLELMKQKLAERKNRIVV